MDEIVTINGVEYTRRDAPAERRVVVLQRGWVTVGRYAEVGDEIVLTDAMIVRRWGTTKGLGELAAKGPLPETVLDPAGTVRAHRLAVVMTFDCEPDAWS